MGNEICCEGKIHESLIITQLIKQNEYVPAQWPQQDEVLANWFSSHEQDNRVQKPLRKHIYRPQYFLGEWNGGIPEGKCLLYVPDEYIYDGQFVKGEPSGEAQLKFLQDKCEYRGNVKSGKAEGQGIFENSQEKYKFEGQWTDAKPIAGKIVLYSDPNVIEINIESFQTRQASVIYKDMRQYEGQIMIDRLVPHGKGKVTFPFNSSKISYEGDWKEGKIHGKGVYLWKDKSRFEGEYVDGQKEGDGIFTYASGKKYVGQWKGGVQEGLGILYSPDGGELKIGEWTKGKFSNQLTKEQYEMRKSQLKQMNPESQKVNEQKNSLTNRFGSEKGYSNNEEPSQGIKRLDSKEQIKQTDSQMIQSNKKNNDQEVNSYKIKVEQKDEPDKNEQQFKPKEEKNSRIHIQPDNNELGLPPYEVQKSHIVLKQIKEEE